MTFYRLAELERIGTAVDAKSAGERPAIRGERMELGYYRYPAGTRKAPHAHPQEQIVAVIKGRLGYRVGADVRILGPGEAVRIPPNVEHDNWALDEDVEFISCKA
ncbi:MAG: cupin domain-containing protein [Burkholderiales bacterium]|nr:cupin domain-containing protein [Burkholderiales bacterium]